MATSKSDEDDSEDATLAEAGGRKVTIRKDVKQDYDALPEKTRSRFRRIMEMWCQGHRLTPEMFNANEGRSPKKNTLIQAFKAFKIRLYGFASGHRFKIVEIDAAKKQEKADVRILDRAKRRVDEY